jgi:hypothetical protein
LAGSVTDEAKHTSSMNFHVGRLGRGERLVALGALALFVTLFFFKWFSVNVPKLFSAFVSAAGYSTSYTGWHTLTNTRWVLLLAILAAVALVVLVGSDRKPRLPVSVGVIVTALGALATLLVFYRTIVNHPGGSGVSVKLGAYLALAACAVLTYGGYVVITQEDVAMPEEDGALAP